MFIDSATPPVRIVIHIVASSVHPKLPRLERRFSPLVITRVPDAERFMGNCMKGSDLKWVELVYDE